jgi:adenylate kinase
VYERDTAPLLDYYAERDLLITINGDDTVDAVFAAITAAVDEAR